MDKLAGVIKKSMDNSEGTFKDAPSELVLFLIDCACRS